MLHEDILSMGYTPKKIQKLASDSTVRYRYYDSEGNLEYKACTRCNNIKHREEYSHRKSTVDGLESKCQVCFNEAEREYRKQNPWYMSGKNKRRADRYSQRTSEQVEESRKNLRPSGRKVCVRCKNSKTLKEYPKSSITPDGLSNECRPCGKARQAKFREDNPGHTSKIQKNLRHKNLQRSHEEVLKDQKRIRPDGTKKCSTCNIVFPLELFHNDRGGSDGKSGSCGRCAREYQLWHKKGQVLQYWEERGIPLECYVCGDEWDHIDHVIPKTLNGTDDDQNLLPMCEHHNTSKWATPLHQWLYQKHPIDMERVLRKVIFEYGVDPFPSQS